MLNTELLITRHGEAVCNVTGIVGGDLGCTGLTDLGRSQVSQLARRLRAEQHLSGPIHALYVSPRLRTRQSGDILGDVLQLPLTVAEELVGPDHGLADGRPWEETKSGFAGPPQAHPDRPHAPGAEPWFAYLDRTTDALQGLLQQHAGQRILLAAHGETIEASHTLLLGLPRDACTRTSFRTDHACITRWQHHTNRFGRTVWMLAAHNDTAHLTPAAGPA